MAKTEQNIRGKVGNAVFYRIGNETRVRHVDDRLMVVMLHDNHLCLVGCQVMLAHCL